MLRQDHAPVDLARSGGPAVAALVRAQHLVGPVEFFRRGREHLVGNIDEGRVVEIQTVEPEPAGIFRIGAEGLQIRKLARPHGIDGGKTVGPRHREYLLAHEQQIVVVAAGRTAPAHRQDRQAVGAHGVVEPARDQPVGARAGLHHLLQIQHARRRLDQQDQAEPLRRPAGIESAFHVNHVGFVLDHRHDDGRNVETADEADILEKPFGLWAVDPDCRLPCLEFRRRQGGAQKFAGAGLRRRRVRHAVFQVEHQDIDRKGFGLGELRLDISGGDDQRSAYHRLALFSPCTELDINNMGNGHRRVA